MEHNNWEQLLLKLIVYFKETINKKSLEDLVNLCIDTPIIRGSVEKFLEKYKKTSRKNSAYAALKKEEGNKKYKEKDYGESLELYTESIFYADKGDDCLPLAYANRALAFQQMGSLSESILNIDMALATGYPKPLLLKLRKAKCLVKLGDAEKAREVLKEALNNSPPKDSQNLQNLLHQELEKIKNLKNIQNSTNNEKLPQLAGGENKNYVSASKYLDVHFDQTRGRHVVANRDIEVGEVLLVEKPFAFVMLEKGCPNCCSETQTPIPCWNCVDVQYCSPECRDDFWKSVHSFECGFASLFKSVGIAHLSIRIILKASSSLNELKKLLSSISEPEYENGIVPYKSKGYDSVYYLVHHSEKYKATDLFQYALTALLLSLYLKKCTNYFPAASDEEDLRFLTLVVCRHILQLICNGHSISSVRCELQNEGPTMGEEEVRTATSIYPSASMINHSCEKTIMISFFKDTLIVIASKRIKKGEEVFTCYGPQAAKMKRAKRQEILSNQYFFDCKCTACSAKFDIYDKFTAFKCTNCKGPVVHDEKNVANSVCQDCGQVCEISDDLLAKTKKFYSLKEEGEMTDDVNLALKKFLESWRIGKDIFYKFHKDLCLAANLVAKCFVHLDDFHKSVSFLKCSVRSVEELFGSFSTEFADEAKKLADIISVCAIRSEGNAARELARLGLNYYEKAENVFKLLFTERDINVCREVKLNKMILENILRKSRRF